MNSVKSTLLNLIRTRWWMRFILFPILRPVRFRDEFIYSLVDYLNFKKTVQPYLKWVQSQPVKTPENAPALLIVVGNGMNTHWCQIWAVLSARYQKHKYQTFVLTNRNQLFRNIYFFLFGVKPIYFEDLGVEKVTIDQKFDDQIGRLEAFLEFKNFEYEGAPFGQMAMSTFGRQRATGVIDVTVPENREEIRKWLRFLFQTMKVAQKLYAKHNIQMLFFTEVFMEEFGAFYYGALLKDLNIMRFAGTVRDEAVIVQHLTKASDRTHHAAVTDQSWTKIKNYPESKQMDIELQQNFKDRYGDRWQLSSRNQPNTRVMTIEEARKILGLAPGRKAAVIYSHILYDTMFFFGTDLFPCYADWFVESVKAACKNPNVQWFIKVHPSNLWRGDLEHYFGGEYEEVRLIKKYVGELPPHVTLVYPNTEISPLTWIQLTDFGITVRGTTGIELGAYGNTVITAGTGRYEKVGFTVNPKSIDEYLDILSKIPNITTPTPEQRRLGARYAYATFCMKPFTMDFFKPVPRTGKKIIFSSDDMIFHGNFKDPVRQFPESIERFVAWSFDKNSIDLLNPWPETAQTTQGAMQSAEA